MSLIFGVLSSSWCSSANRVASGCFLTKVGPEIRGLSVVGPVFGFVLTKSGRLYSILVLAGGGLLLDCIACMLSESFARSLKTPSVCGLVKGCDDVLVVALVAILATASVVDLDTTSLELGVDVEDVLAWALTLRRLASGMFVVESVCG